MMLRLSVLRQCLWATLMVITTWSVSGQQPEIYDFNPKAGASGDMITVSGSGFSVGTIRVFFWNGVPGTVIVRTDTLLDVRVPNNVQAGPLGIQRNLGTTNYTSMDFVPIGNGPYITNVTPMFGPTNQLVVISGLHLSGVAANGVQFGGVRSVDASVNAAGTMISVHVPFGGKTGPISVTTLLGTSNTAPFTVIGPAPYVTHFSPTQGSAGTMVTVEGAQLDRTTNLTFSGIRGANLIVQSPLMLRVDAPNGVVSGPLTLQSASGQFTTAQNFYVQPVITNVAPGGGRTGTNVVIRGLNFLDATGVSFNGLPASFVVSNNNTIRATVPPGATTGLIRVTTPPYSALSANNFIIRPTIYGFAPAAGTVGSSITITGANLNAASPAVFFNGVKAAAPTGVTSNLLTAVVPVGATTGPITVTNVAGSHTTLTNFFVPPVITHFSPTNSPPGSVVTIYGQSFLEATRVEFTGAVATDFVVHSNSAITAIVPTEVKTGPLKVTTPGGTATSSSVFYGAPHITGFSPPRGLPGTNVTILGTNFLDTRRVRFGALPATVTYADNGRLVAIVPNGVVSGPITVEAPGGTNSSSSSFIVDYTSNLEVWLTNSVTAGTVSSQMVYSITMINRGPYDANNVRWTNTFPSSFVIETVTVGPPWVAVLEGSSVIATSPSAVIGGTSTMLVKVRPQSAGTMSVETTIQSDNTDPTPANNTASLSTWVEPLALLNIAPSWGNMVRLSWPLLLSNYLLEAKTNIDSPAWSPFTNPPTQAGNQQFLLDTNTGGLKVYRLRK